LIDTDGDEDWRQQQNADFAAALRAAGHRAVATRKVLGRSHMSVWTDMSEGASEETSSAILQFAARVLDARDFILTHRTDYDAAVRGFRWPSLRHFNWALDYFDSIAAGNDAPALHLVEEDGKIGRAHV